MAEVNYFRATDGASFILQPDNALGKVSTTLHDVRQLQNEGADLNAHLFIDRYDLATMLIQAGYEEVSR